MKTKHQNILDSAKIINSSAKTWIELLNALFDPDIGLLTKEYQTRDERDEFIKTDEYKAIRQLILDKGGSKWIC